MNPKELKEAVTLLCQSKQGLNALEALQFFIQQTQGLESTNRDALGLLVAAHLGQYPLTLRNILNQKS